MRKLLLPLWLLLTAQPLVAQGLVNFFNNPSTLVSYQPTAGGPVEALPAIHGQFYFGLFIAPQGSTDPVGFTFTGVYATNLAAPGRFSGGAGIPVPGWYNEVRSFLVHGWSADLGHDWNPAWLQGAFPAGGLGSVFGTSAIGMAEATGPRGIPDLNIFGGAVGINSGFVLSPIPEPVTGELLAFGFGILLVCRRLNRSREPNRRGLVPLGPRLACAQL